MKNPSEHTADTSEELNEQTTSTLDALEGTAHEQATAVTSDNPLFRPNQDHNSGS